MTLKNLATDCEEPDVAIAAPPRRSGVIRVRLTKAEKQKRKTLQSIMVGALVSRDQYKRWRQKGRELDLSISQMIRAAMDRFVDDPQFHSTHTLCAHAPRTKASQMKNAR